MKIEKNHLNPLKPVKQARKISTRHLKVIPIQDLEPEIGLENSKNHKNSKILQNSNEIIENWINYCGHLNQTVSFMHNGNSLKGQFKKVNLKGHACIELDGNDQFFPNIILD